MCVRERRLACRSCRSCDATPGGVAVKRIRIGIEPHAVRMPTDDAEHHLLQGAVLAHQRQVGPYLRGRVAQPHRVSASRSDLSTTAFRNRNGQLVTVVMNGSGRPIRHRFQISAGNAGRHSGARHSDLAALIRRNRASSPGRKPGPRRPGYFSSLNNDRSAINTGPS